MPTYDYECRKCGHQFEEFQNITAKPLKKCPICKKLSLERLIGAGAGVIFRGSGFYVTDYRSKEYKEKAKAETATPKKGTPSGEKKSTTKKDA
ncbi:MAG: FmdB family zinc ribbon protein [Planctomycetota bacterium]